MQCDIHALDFCCGVGGLTQVSDVAASRSRPDIAETWPEDLRASCHRKATGGTYPSVYGRMEWDRPAPTMTTQCFGFGNGRFGHPEQDRAITLREAAILQTFPADYAFLDDGEELSFARLGRLIGNATPVRLDEVIAETFRSHVEQVAGTPAN